MKRQVISVLLLLAILCSFAGCVIESEQPIGTQSSDTVAATDGKDSESTDTDETTQAETSEVTVAETVVYDENNIKITVKELTEDFMGKGLKFLVENGTDKNITLSVDDVIINGITVNCAGYIDVSAGKKTNDVITVYNETLETAGIETFATISFPDAHIVDTDSYDTLFKTPFTVETSVAKEYKQNIDETGDVVYDENGIKVIAKVLQDELIGKSVLLLVENTTDKDFIVQAENISVNGYTITAWLYDTVFGDTVRFSEIDLSSTDLEENDIEDIENVTFSLEFINPETYGEIATTGEVEVVVK